ncbi:hypothetical protein CGRA01v4_10500 [Colletotrichum graminicola]|nr:hypothetical protein CGRA01v4_10500 [Colletotrichum graminicola]
MQVQRETSTSSHSPSTLLLRVSTLLSRPSLSQPGLVNQSGEGGAFHHCHRYLAATISTPACLVHPSILLTSYSRIALSARSQAPGRLEILLPTVHTHHHPVPTLIHSFFNHLFCDSYHHIKHFTIDKPAN